MSSQTRIEVHREGDRVRVRTTHRCEPDRPAIRPMLIETTVNGAVISLVPEGALLLAGDDILVDITVGPGAHLDLREAAGTVAYAMRGSSARWSTRIVLGAGAGLTWAGEAFVAAAGSRSERLTEIVLGSGATAAIRELLVLGRHGEAGGALRNALRVRRADGTPLLVEDLVLDESTPSHVLGPHRAIGTVALFGAELPENLPGTRLDLDGGWGTVVRWLAGTAHEIDVSAAWLGCQTVAPGHEGG